MFFNKTQIKTSKMKKFVVFLMTVLGTLVVNAQVSEKELDGIEFLQMDDTQGGIIYGFTKGDKMIGPNLHIRADGMRIYTYFDLEGLAQDVQMIEEPSTGMLLLAEMKDNVMHGNAFKMTGQEIDWAQTYKNGEIKKIMDVEYKSKSSNRENCLGNCLGGFGMFQTSDDQLLLGYFFKLQPTSPVVHTFDGGKSDMYLGGMRKWERQGLGKYIYSNEGNIYFGMWDKDKRTGLGIWFNKDGGVDSKGYFKKGELIKNM